LFVTTLVGKAIALDVQKTYTIDDVKVYIKAGYGYLVQWQCLKSAGKPLDDGHELSDYNIQKQSMLRSTSRLRGSHERFSRRHG
jgi:hypothetical protein